MIVVEPADDAREDKPAELIRKEEVASLTKQDSSSQSILAPLVQPQSKVFHAPEDGNRKLNPEKQNVEMSGDLPENLADRDGMSFNKVPIGEDSHPSTDPIVTTPENLLLAENSGGGAPSEESGRVELEKEQLSTPEKDIPARRPTKPRLPVAIFSETSSESATGFHFSLPKEPLKPLMSATPPPIRPVRYDTPDSEERSSRRSTIPDVVLPVVTETPGMSSQGMIWTFSFRPSAPLSSFSVTHRIVMYQVNLLSYLVTNGPSIIDRRHRELVRFKSGFMLFWSFLKEYILGGL